MLELPNDNRISGFFMTSHNSVIVVIEDLEKSVQRYILHDFASREKEFLTVIGQIGQFSSSIGGSGDDEFLATVHVSNLRIINVQSKEKFK